MRTPLPVILAVLNLAGLIPGVLLDIGLVVGLALRGYSVPFLVAVLVPLLPGVIMSILVVLAKRAGRI